MDPAAVTDADIHRAILAAWRIEQPRLITGLSRMLRDVPLAEELTQDALVAALEHLARDRHSRKARRLADGGRKTPGAGPSAPRPNARAQARDGRSRHGSGAAGDARSGRCARRRHRGRTAAADLHRLSPAAVARRPRGAGAADDLRSDHRGDREGLSGSGCDDRPAYRAREADAFGIRTGLRDPAWRGAVGTARVRAGGVYLIFNEGYTAARGEHWLRPQLCQEALAHRAAC